ncbi:hypothetical protein [Leifsonia sp. NPDC080035]|uniref:Uncharacterized protein n=1 Tax=Leifsonia sp. NPDC080035 TaxID=3143936 RepID=A0AAU7G5C2_9MICO
MSVLVLLGPLGTVAAVGGVAIWRMEAARRRVLSSDGVEGIVAGKRVSAEHGELRLPAHGTAPGAIMVTPTSYILTIATSHGERDLVVDEDTLASYEIGDSFP